MPKLKRNRYYISDDQAIQGRVSRTYQVFPATDFAKECIALLPRNPTDPALPRTELVEALLREEFGHPILEQLTSLPSSETGEEKSKYARREKHVLAVAEAREIREECVRSWPQIVPRDVVCESFDTFYECSR